MFVLSSIQLFVNYFPNGNDLFNFVVTNQSYDSFYFGGNAADDNLRLCAELGEPEENKPKIEIKK